MFSETFIDKIFVFLHKYTNSKLLLFNFFFFSLYFDYPGCYAYALFAVKSLIWACIWSVYLRFLVNRHSPPRLNHAPGSYPHCMINLPSHLITHTAFSNSWFWNIDHEMYSAGGIRTNSVIYPWIERRMTSQVS